MTSIRFDVVGGRALVAELTGKADALPEITRATTIHHGQLLRTKVMANASGRPGPNVVTGDYRRSINMRVINHAGRTIVIVGTNKPQGRRLEFGFHGVDSAGRHYNQPAYPHFGPAVDWVAPKYFAAMEKVASLG